MRTNRSVNYPGKHVLGGAEWNLGVLAAYAAPIVPGKKTSKIHKK